jgi:hypothetical protein
MSMFLFTIKIMEISTCQGCAGTHPSKPKLKHAEITATRTVSSQINRWTPIIIRVRLKRNMGTICEHTQRMTLEKVGRSLTSRKGGKYRSRAKHPG